MPTGTINFGISMPGITTSGTISRTGSGGLAIDETLPAGLAGTLTRSDADTGVITLAEGHGLTLSDTVTVFWSGGLRYGMSITNSGSTTITVDTGDGNDLPAIAATAVVVGKQIAINAPIEGDDVTLLAIISDQAAHVDLQDSGSSSLLARSLAANEPYSWHSDSGETNPIAGDTVAVMMAANGSTSAASLKTGTIFDATP